MNNEYIHLLLFYLIISVIRRHLSPFPSVSTLAYAQIICQYSDRILIYNM